MDPTKKGPGATTTPGTPDSQHNLTSDESSGAPALVEKNDPFALVQTISPETAAKALANTRIYDMQLARKRRTSLNNSPSAPAPPGPPVFEQWALDALADDEQPKRSDVWNPELETTRRLLYLRADKEARRRLAEDDRPPGGIAAKLLDRSGLRELAPPEPMIADTLDRGTVAYLYGKHGSYKSFIALDWALSVATGRPWQGRARRAMPRPLCGR